MQISEAMDECTRQKMMILSPGRTRVQIDIPQIVLGLLNFTFKSDFSNEKYYMQWKNRQEWDLMSPSGRAEVISAIKQIALTLSCLPGQFDLQSETYYWTSAYHEADEFLKLLKLTWSTLGTTQQMHDAIFSWVLFQQFVGTDEALLLESATIKLQELLSAKVDDEKMRLYRNSLICSIHCNGNDIKLSLVDSVLYSISIWCESKLQDYHLHFSQQPSLVKRVMSLVSAVGVLNFSNMKLSRLNILNKDVAKIVESYVKRSIQAGYKRAASNIDHISEVEKKHPLGTIVAMMLHQIYWERLKPFLDGVLSLSDVAVLPAADLLYHGLTQLCNTGNGSKSEALHRYPMICQELALCVLFFGQIGEVAKPIILDWVIA